MAFVGIALYGRGLLVDTHDGADALVQVLVGKGHRVTNHEVSTLCTGRWRRVVWRGLGRSVGVGDDRGIGQGPAPARSGVLDHGLGLPQLKDTVPPYSPDLNPVEYLWAWLKRHALANFCPHSLTELKTTARNRLRSAQQCANIIAACWKQAELW